jgi:hypothetical protein
MSGSLLLSSFRNIALCAPQNSALGLPACQHACLLACLREWCLPACLAFLLAIPPAGLALTTGAAACGPLVP